MAEKADWDRLLLPALAVLLGVMFLAMPVWRGQPRESGERYAIGDQEFMARVETMIRTSPLGVEDGQPVLRPPPGDVYVTATRWSFAPALELVAGQSYRLHVASRDSLHGLVIDGRETLLLPGTASVLTLTPAAPGRIALQCSEYCGLEHNKMRSWITVTAGEPR